MPGSFSDFVCILCSALRGGSVRKNPKHTVAWDRGRMKADIRGCRFVPSRFSETKPQMVPRHLNIGFQGF